MAFWNGLGGSVVVGANTLNCHSHTVRKTARLVENTHSGSTATNFEKVVPHYEWTVKVPWDDQNLPDVTVGLVEGAKVAIKFNDGSSGLFCTLTNTSVESIEEELNVPSNIILAVISGKGGTLTRQV